MAENSREVKMNDVNDSVKTIRQGEVVEAEVFMVTDNDSIILTLPNHREATMHKDHYTYDQDIKLKDVVKVGDKLLVKVIKIEKEDDNNNIYVSRLPLIGNTIYQDLEKIKEEEKTIVTKIKEARENGFVLGYKNTDLFIPIKLIDNKIVANKEEYLGKELEVLIKDIKKKENKTTVICTRLPIIKKEKEKQAQLREEARKKALDSINEGDVLDVEVVKILKNSIEVSINQYLNGQVRISQISHEHIVDIEQYVKVGEKHKVVVLEKQGKRIDLSIKKLLKTPFELFAQNYPEGSLVEALVEKKVDNGYMVKLEGNIQSFLSNYEIIYNLRKISSIVINPGDKVLVKVVKIENDEKKVYISKKQVEANPWDSISLNVGDKIEVEVIQQQPNGAGLDVVYNKIGGFISKRDLTNQLESYNSGDKIQAFVLKVNPTKWDLVLTQKETRIKKEQQAQE